ncbi:hypothetical protein [Rhodococcus sp. IEGM 1366]|nr:hypothetical protein [Rhodococcus sp. IEGM 1366]
MSKHIIAKTQVMSEIPDVSRTSGPIHAAPANSTAPTAASNAVISNKIRH